MFIRKGHLEGENPLEVQFKLRQETPCVHGLMAEAGRGRPVSMDLEAPRGRGARTVHI